MSVLSDAIEHGSTQSASYVTQTSWVLPAPPVLPAGDNAHLPSHLEMGNHGSSLNSLLAQLNETGPH